jgi:autotransporter translocation and assembly factor TamB
MRPDRRSAVKTVLRIVRTLVVALVVLFVVAVGVGIFGVLEEDDGMARRWPKRP